MSTIKFSNETAKRNAQKVAFNAYAKELLKNEYLFGATENEIETLLRQFDTDTDKCSYLLIRQTDSKVNGNGELTTVENGETVVWENAYVYGSVTWKTDDNGNVTETRNYFRAPLDVTTWNMAQRVVNGWIDYAERTQAAIIDAIKERATATKKECEQIASIAATLIEYTGNVPVEFVNKYRETYDKGIKFGFAFTDKVNQAFATEK